MSVKVVELRAVAGILLLQRVPPHLRLVLAELSVMTVGQFHAVRTVDTPLSERVRRIGAGLMRECVRGGRWHVERGLELDHWRMHWRWVVAGRSLGVRRQMRRCGGLWRCIGGCSSSGVLLALAFPTTAFS